MEEARSKYNINVVRDVFLFAEPKLDEMLRKLLKPHYFLHPRGGKELPGYRDETHFVVVAVDMMNRVKLQEAVRLLGGIESPLATKFVYVVEPDSLSREQLLLFQELGVRFVAAGVTKSEELKERLKRICVEFHQVGSLEGYEVDIDRACKTGDTASLQRTFEKLKEMPQDSEDVQRLLAMTATGLGDMRRAEVHYKKLLQINPQNLWAANGLGRAYLRSRRMAEGIELLRRLSLFHELNSERILALGDAYADVGNAAAAEEAYKKGDQLTGGTDERFKEGLAKVKLTSHDVKGALGLLAGRRFSTNIVAFLNMRAIIAMKAGKPDEGMAYYASAFEGCSEADSDVRAKLKFNMGLAYARNGQLETAQKCLQESVVLGAGRFERARKPLEVVKAAIKNRDKPRKPGAPTTSSQTELDEADWETLF